MPINVSESAVFLLHPSVMTLTVAMSGTAVVAAFLGERRGLTVVVDVVDVVGVAEDKRTFMANW
jgi:hypothetical protein